MLAVVTERERPRERTMRNFLFCLTSAHLMMVGIAHAQGDYCLPEMPGQVQVTQLPVTQAPSYTAPRVYGAATWGRHSWRRPGRKRSLAICRREQRAGEELAQQYVARTAYLRRCANQQLATRTRKGRLAAAPENRKGKSTEQRDGDGVSQWMSDRCADVHLSE